MAFRDMNENFILQDEHHTTQWFDKLKINWNNNVTNSTSKK